MRYLWKYSSPCPAEALQTLETRSSCTRQLLWNRGMRTLEEAENFLNPSWETGLHDPLQFRHLLPATERLFLALKQGERITVHGDYDADGVTGSTVMITTLREIEKRLTGRTTEASCIDFYIPHRDAEGYGLHRKTVELLHERGTKVIITVDCGIACVPEIALAREKGMDVIVLDHHTFGEVLPDGWLIHPGLPEETYPFKKLAAVGVAFKFATAFLMQARERGIDVPVGWEKWLLDLVAIATVTDMVGLVGENRVLERYGLLVLRKTRRPGLLALFEVAKIEQVSITAETVGFMIGPRINAAGRMDHASLALRLMLVESVEEAQSLAKELERCNRARQEKTRDMMVEAEKLVEEQAMRAWPLQIVWHETWSPALAGLVAGRLMEACGRPVIAIGKHGENWIGSGRSPACFDITKAMRVAGEGILTRIGGHLQACGFALIDETRLPELRQKLLAYAEEAFQGVQLEPELLIDVDISLAELTWGLWEDLERCEPFGQENPRPTFLVRNVLVTKVDRLGEGKHLRVQVRNKEGASFKCMAFKYPETAFVPTIGSRVDLVFHLAVNEWQGKRTLEGRMVDVREAGE